MFSSYSKSGASATHINSQSKSPTVAASTPTTTLATTKPPPPPPPPTTTFLPDCTSMLGLHNILLIAPPPSSFHLLQPPINSSAHHHHQVPANTINHQDINTNPNDQDSWTGIKKHQREPNFAKKSAFNVVEGGDDDHNGSSYSSLRVCKDCGNRAKKECEYRRCRNCCKSKGYDCATHVKSTWVPAARRRDKHGGRRGVGGSSGSSSGGGGGVGGKRPRENVTSTSNSFSTSNANAAASFSLDTGSSHQDASFKQSLPGQVRAPAVFRCIRVTAINSGEAGVAYQAIVNICGHVFKGFLYDQGIDEDNAFPCISKIHSTGRNRDSTSPIVDPPNAFAASGNQRFLEGNE